MNVLSSLLIAAALVIGAGVHVAGSQTPTRSEIITRVDSLASAYLVATHTPSVSLAVLRGSDTLVMKGYGDASIAPRRPATSSTIYPIGSITKQFTAAEIMRLAERGKLSIDDPVTKYLPDVPTHGRTITIRRLLNHTSGLHNYAAKPSWRASWSQPLSPRQVIALVDHDSLDFNPGSRWSYSNTGYILLGMIIEKVTGQTYASQLEQDLFKPLGLSQTSYCPSHHKDPMFADGYATSTGTPKPATYIDMSQWFAAGALCSTARDIVKWQRALESGTVVDAASYTLMTTPDTLIDGSRLTYGFGLTIGALGAHRQIGHNGAASGFTNMSLFYPDDSVNIVVLSNADAGPGLRSGGTPVLAANIARVVFGIPLTVRNGNDNR